MTLEIYLWLMVLLWGGLGVSILGATVWYWWGPR